MSKQVRLLAFFGSNTRWKRFSISARATAIPLLLFVVLSLSAMAPITPAMAEKLDRPVRVLLLHSYHHGNKWTDDETRGIVSVLGENRPGFQLEIEYMDTKKLTDDRYFDQLADIYTRKYGDASFNAIIAADDNAFFFLREHRDKIFPGVPVVFCGINFFKENYLDGIRGMTGINEEANLKGAIDIALALHPDTREMVLITDATETGRRISERFRELIPAYGKALTFRILDDAAMETIQEEVSHLETGSLVLFTFFFRDRTGRFFEYYESPALIAASSKVPVYGAWDYSLGHGIVGGLLNSGFDQGKVAGELVQRILGGESVDTIPVIMKSPNRYFFDYRQLGRFSIKTSQLPENSTIINAPNPSYLIDKTMVWSTLGGLSLMVFFIAFLLVNIVERKKAEAAYRASVQNYHTLVDNLRVGIFRSSGDIWHGHYLHINQAMLSIFGFEDEESFKGIPVASLYQRPEERSLVLGEIVEKGFIKDRELAMLRKDGAPITVSCTVAVQYDDKGAVKWLDGVMEDVTERKSLEDQLRQAQKMEAVGTLAGGIAHDFNNLLTAIIGYANLAKAAIFAEEVRSEYLQHILTCSAKASNLTRSLLAFSRKQIINPKAIDPNTVIRLVEPLIKRLLGEEIKLRICSTDGPINIFADENQIEQILMNLATNARDAMPDGGEFSIRIERTASLPDGICSSGYSTVVDYVAISVTDTGIGMDESLIPKIFEPFFTTKDMAHGTGLGLSTTYGIVKQHGGEIEVKSQKGKGTVFRIFFPVYCVPAEDELVQPAPRLPEGGNETILVAEDDTDVRTLIAKVLRMAGYTVLEAVDGEDAVRQFVDYGAGIDLVLSDVMMPKMNGREAVERITAIRPGTRVLLMSGYTADAINRKRTLENDIPFVFKPVAPVVLLDRVRTTLDELSVPLHTLASTSAEA